MAKKNKPNYLWMGIAVVAVIVLAIVFISNSNKSNNYVCLDGSVVSDASLCSKQNYCGDGVCNTGESCDSCIEDCGKCPIDCTIKYYPAKSISPYDSRDSATCTDSIGAHYATTSPHCDFENPTIKLPNTIASSPKIVRDNVACENNLCVIRTEEVDNCNKYKQTGEIGICGEDQEPYCAFFDSDGNPLRKREL